MRKKQLGNSDLQVSVVGLGCMMFGSMVDQDSTTACVNAALDADINFFDTADIYGKSPSSSEEYLAKALGAKRKDIILTTKFGANSSGRGGSIENGGTRDYIMAKIEESLSRLNTDYLDLYQYHFPDINTPAEETLRALEDLIQQGKVRHIGCSNMNGAQQPQRRRPLMLRAPTITSPRRTGTAYSPALLKMICCPSPRKTTSASFPTSPWSPACSPASTAKASPTLKVHAWRRGAVHLKPMNVWRR